MYQENYLDKAIDEIMRAEAAAEMAKHVPTGKLSASILGNPTQWQVLKTLGVGKKEVDDYTLRKFARGKAVEDWLVAKVPHLVQAQAPVEYLGVVGLVDALVDTNSGYDFNFGLVPHEIKSVTNAKFKRITKTHEADPWHKLQAGLYALALGSSHYCIDYAASDDLRVLSFVYPVAEVADEIHSIIDAYKDCMQRRYVPVFVPRYPWQATKTYNHYPEWSELTESACQLALQYHFPGIWEAHHTKLTNTHDTLAQS